MCLCAFGNIMSYILIVKTEQHKRLKCGNVNSMTWGSDRISRMRIERIETMERERDQKKKFSNYDTNFVNQNRSSLGCHQCLSNVCSNHFQPNPIFPRSLIMWNYCIIKIKFWLTHGSFEGTEIYCFRLLDIVENLFPIACDLSLSLFSCPVGIADTLKMHKGL